MSLTVFANLEQETYKTYPQFLSFYVCHSTTGVAGEAAERA